MSVGNVFVCVSVAQDQSLRHRNTNLCMELSSDGQKVDMKPCSGVDRQIWYWKRKTPNGDQKTNAVKLHHKRR